MHIDDAIETLSANMDWPDEPSCVGEAWLTVQRAVREMSDEVKRLKQWVADLQGGMFVTCVYCGHCYGPSPGTPVAMADLLRKHIEQCPEHPLSAAMKEIERLRDELLSKTEDLAECCRLLQDAARLYRCDLTKRDLGQGRTVWIPEWWYAAAERAAGGGDE